MLVGSPHFSYQIAACAMIGVMYNQLGRYGGDTAVAVMTIVHRVAMVIAMPIFGINQGMQPIVGFNYGAARYDRVKQALLTAILAGTAITTAGFAVSMLFPAQLIHLFARGATASELLASQGTRAMRVAQMMLPLIGFQVISASYFQAVGKPRTAMLLMLSRQVLLLIPALLILPCFFGLSGVWAAIPAADLCSSLLTGCCLLVELRHLDSRHLDAEAAELVRLAQSS